jgi:(2Fe-2S) ferredoxin
MKILICTNQRHAPNPHSCGNSRSIEMASRLEDGIRQAGLDISVERVACLSMCANGPNISLMPDGKTWQRVDMQKIDEILDFLRGRTAN